MGADPIPKPGSRFAPCNDRAEMRSVLVGGGPRVFYPDCPGERNARLKALARLVEEMFDAPRQSATRPPATSISCKHIHDKPFVFGTTRADNPNSTIELRWADWVRPGTVVLD